MRFAPTVDRRLAWAVQRLPRIDCSADVWRALRRRARRIGCSTPSYESVRLLVHRERERRAMIVAVTTTLLQVAYRRIPTTPLDVSRLYERNLRTSRRRFRVGRRWRPPP